MMSHSLIHLPPAHHSHTLTISFHTQNSPLPQMGYCTGVSVLMRGLATLPQGGSEAFSGQRQGWNLEDPQQDPLAVHCFCVCSGSVLLGVKTFCVVREIDFTAIISDFTVAKSRKVSGLGVGLLVVMI